MNHIGDRNVKRADELICEEKSTCCFTGHRPEKLSRPEEEVREWLDERIREAIQDGYSTFISGMARGVDLWAAESVLRLKEGDSTIRLVCASPYNGFENRWSEKWQERYRVVLRRADTVVFVCSTYSPACFQRRNEWMVDHSSRLIAVYEGAGGGTKNTIDYAQRSSCKIIM